MPRKRAAAVLQEPVDDGSAPIDKLEREADMSMADWIRTFGSQGDIRIHLDRKSPLTYRGVKCNGRIDTYDGPVSLEQIKETHGGGRYQLQVHRARKTGQGYQYATARSFDIAGTPKIDALVDYESDNESNGKSSAAKDELASQAMEIMAKNLEQERLRSDEYRHSQTGTDWEGIERVMAPMRDELAAVRHENATLQKQLFERMSAKPDTSQQDRLLDIFGNATNDHSTRIQELRAQHDSELRSIRDFNRDEIKRREDRFERELENGRRAHEREMENMRATHNLAIESQRNAFEMRIEGQRETIARIERELSDVRTELSTLRARKDQTPVQQMQSLLEIKTAMEQIMPKEDEEDTPTWQRVLESGPVKNLLGSAAERMQSRGPSPDDVVIVKMADGSQQQMTRAQAMQMMQQQQAAAAAAAEEPEEELSQAEQAGVDPAEMKQAVTYMETAFKGGTDAAIFAASARNMVPESILEVLRKRGVEAFLNEVADIPTGSPLHSVAGRNWVRDVAEFLLTGEIKDKSTADEP